MSATRTRVLRLEQGLTQRELAERSGVNERTVRNIEHDRHKPGLLTLERLAEVLGVPVADLLDEPQGA